MLVRSLLLLVLHVMVDGAARTKQDKLVVDTQLGKLRGSVIRSRLGRDIYSFRGVRFAKPPLGERRFKAPEQLDPWNGIVNATEDGNACMQPYANGSIAPVSEDCLFLNVYTTQLPCSGCEHPNRSVLFFIHPGGWYEFSAISTVLGPQYLLDQDILLVTANYRLGAFGLLSTGDGVLKGNYAMKDQVAALRWVQANIRAFGGNPSSVTIAGYSVGGASVFFNLVSPMTHGLFQRAISMSASIDTMWDIDHDPIVKAKKHAGLVGCPTETSQQIADCLRTKTAEEIAYSFDGLSEWGYEPILVYYPVIEAELDENNERYLDQEPYPQLLSGNFKKIPLMTGYTKDEFSWKARYVIQNSTLASDMNDNFETVAPIAFMYERGTNRSRYVSQELKKFYLNNQPITNASQDGLGKLFSDSIIGFGEDRGAKIISGISDAPVYFYRFSYQGRYSFVYYPNTTTSYGVFHHDELIYLFYMSALEFPFFQETDPEVQNLKRLTTMWSNFVKTGNPTPNNSSLLNNVQWPPMKPENLTYLDIGSELLVENGLYRDRMEVWDRLFPFSTSKKGSHGNTA